MGKDGSNAPGLAPSSRASHMEHMEKRKTRVKGARVRNLLHPLQIEHSRGLQEGEVESMCSLLRWPTDKSALREERTNRISRASQRCGVGKRATGKVETATLLKSAPPHR